MGRRIIKSGYGSSVACRMRAAGFTLIELLLAISIFAMVIAVIFSSFRLGIGAWTKGERDIEYYQRMRAVTELLYREISAAYPYWITPGELDKHKNFIAFFGTSDSLKFVSYANLQKTTSGISLLDLWHEEAHGLMLGEAGALASNLSELDALPVRDKDHATVLSPDVRKIEFRYFDKKLRDKEGEWLEQWDPRDKNIRMPRMVEITLTFTNERSETTQERLFVPIMSNLL